MLSALGGACVTDPGNSKRAGTKIVIKPCTGTSGQAWDTFTTEFPAGATRGGQCLEVPLPASPNAVVPDGTAVILGSCFRGQQAQTSYWIPLPDGEIGNAYAGLWLAVRGNSARPGTPLVVSDCYGDIGEIWAEG